MFLLDQDVYYTTYSFLKEKGYNTIRVREIGFNKASDIEILKEAERQSRILITRDKDFGSLIFFSKFECPGIIFLRQLPNNMDQVHGTLLEVLKKYSMEELNHLFITVEADKYRIRHVPSGC